MTGELRQHLRELIDQQRRALAASAPPAFACAGCGCDRETRTHGCQTCANRHLARKWRQDPSKRERILARDRARKRKHA